MINAELIKELRWCGSEDERHEMCVDESYRCPMWNEDRITDDCKAELMRAAADALEAADIKIADYTAAVEALDDSNDAYIKENERLKKRIAELEAQLPKEGEWIWDADTGIYRCSECGGASPREDQDGEYIDCPIYCPNCGAKMRKGELL